MPINLNIGQEMIVGRLGSQAIKIDDMSVSRKHCKIKRLSQTEFEIEDLGSTRGTVVGGLPVYMTRVKADTPLMLGNFKTTVGRLLGTPVAEVVSIGHLERVFDRYEEDTKELSKQRTREQGKRALPMQIGLPLIMGAGMFLDLIIDPGSANAVKGVLSAVCIGMSVFMSVRAISSNDSMIDDQFEINKQFQIDYVCPKCKNFLGMSRPVQALLNAGKCPYCKSRFKR